MTGLSFEFFPPRSEQATRKLDDAVRSLARFDPSYVSVTYGAGGSTAEGTAETLTRIRNRHGLPTAAHVCFGGVRCEHTDAFVDRIWSAGHRRIVALRGDADSVEGEGYADVAGFVAALSDRYPFDVAVACYPEVHPRASCEEADLDVLLAKQEAGASHALSQFFFDAETFLAFRDRARAHGVTMPLVPGLLPIHDIERAISFGEKCGSNVPQWVRERFLHAGRNGQSERAVAEELIVETVSDLCREGVGDLHLYTLNKAALSDAAAGKFREFHPVRRAA